MESAIVPGPRSEFLELARTPSGKLYRKQILKWGEFKHPNIPGAKLKVTEDMGKTLVRNFHDKVCDIVQVPVVGDDNAHTEDPFRNIGEVVDLSIDSDGVYADIDVRNDDAASQLGKTLLGVSAMMHLNYTDTRSGEKVGPTLLHTAVTNRPYITDLKDYEEIVAASADTYGNEAPLVFAAEQEQEDQEVKLTKEELIEALKEQHGIDVEALQMSAVNNDDDDNDDDKDTGAQEIVAALAHVLASAGAVSLSNVEDDDELSLTDVAEAVIELSTEKRGLEDAVATLTAESEKLRLTNAEAEVDGLIRAGRVLPKQKDVMVKLSMNDRETFAALLPEDSIVEMDERGVTVHENPNSEKFDEEVARLSQLANEWTNGGK